MTDDRSLDRAAQSWLESGPTEAPDRAVEAALSRIQTTPQERDLRVPWRAREMSMTARLAAAAIAIAIGVVVGGTLVLRPSSSSSVATGASPALSVAPTQTPTPTPAPTLVAVGALNKRYVSDLYRYSVRYPDTWQLTAGTTPAYPDDVPPDLSLGRTAFFGDTASGHGLMVTSAPLSATRKDLATWTAFVAGQVQKEFGTYLDFGACVQSTRSLLLDGEPANEVDYICPDHDWLWVTAIHALRAYQIAWLDDGGFDSGSLRPLLDKLLQTFAFTS